MLHRNSCPLCPKLREPRLAEPYRSSLTSPCPGALSDGQVSPPMSWTQAALSLNTGCPGQKLWSSWTSRAKEDERRGLMGYQFKSPSGPAADHSGPREPRTPAWGACWNRGPWDGPLTAANKFVCHSSLQPRTGAGAWNVNGNKPTWCLPISSEKRPLREQSLQWDGARMGDVGAVWEWNRGNLARRRQGWGGEADKFSPGRGAA